MLCGRLCARSETSMRVVEYQLPLTEESEDWETPTEFIADPALRKEG